MIDLNQELVRALTSPEARAAIKQLVRDALDESQQAAELLDTRQASELVGRSPEAVRKLAERGVIPCSRLGRKLLFRRDELLAALK